MRYKYHWNEYDCVERVIDTKTGKKITGCKNAVKLLNKFDKENNILTAERNAAIKETNLLGRAMEIMFDTFVGDCEKDRETAIWACITKAQTEAKDDKQ